jgi:hypothetical protein
MLVRGLTPTAADLRKCAVVPEVGIVRRIVEQKQEQTLGFCKLAGAQMRESQFALLGRV